MGLRLVSTRVVVCLPWGLRTEEQAVGASCRPCGRDVALPRAKAGEVAMCLYCALDQHIAPAVEVPPEGVATILGVA